jgi:hypothetical protein
MKLQQRLDRIRQGFEKQALPQAMALMHRATDDLRHSGIADHALKEGQTAPSFELENSGGGRVSLSGLLERGPLVLTFFRGHW